MKVIHAVIVFSAVARCINGSPLEVNSSLDSDNLSQDYSATSIDENGEKRNAHEDEACAEFEEGAPIGSGWLRSDCVTVWSQWANTLDGYQYQSYSYRGVFSETAKEMREQGNPCLVDSFRYPDGVGSSAIRLLATWMFAEEMNCDWINPKSPRPSIDDNGTSLYCHPLRSVIGHDPGPLDQAYDLQNGGWRCEVTNWLRFFRYDAHGVNWQTSGTIKTIHLATRGDQRALSRMIEEWVDEASRSWDNVIFYLKQGSANRLFQLLSSWDGYKREMTRSVLQRYRESFYESPRPWFDERPQCRYSSASKELNFAIHVRLGDRLKTLQRSMNDYFEYLEAFMDRVTIAVTQRGLDPPRFHVFSETVKPCPSEENGAFSEFPTWPVEAYQIPPCLAPITPEDCPEKRAGAPACNPERSGIFRVAGKPLFLHVGIDVQNDISCMIQADGILMGCSTFGQIAGVLNQGLKFFSFGCSGPRTPNHYKMTPPLAIAEKGKMWVPVSGSWHNPTIMSQVIFEAALDEHIENVGAF